MGKRTTANMKANQELNKIFFEYFYPESPRCEANVSPKCEGSKFLFYHHWPKKSTGFYVNQPEKLYDLKHVAMVCWVCHDVLDVKDQSLNEPLFKKLRG